MKPITGRVRFLRALAAAATLAALWLVTAAPAYSGF
jgi:hypothetical protein